MSSLSFTEVHAEAKDESAAAAQSAESESKETADEGEQQEEEEEEEDEPVDINPKLEEGSTHSNRGRCIPIGSIRLIQSVFR